MKTYLLTWNPSHAGADGLNWLKKVVSALGHAKSKRDQWSSGSRKNIQLGNRVFLLRQGKDHPGMIGSGWVTSGWFEDGHWDEQKNEQGLKANYVKVAWDTMVLPADVLPRKKLMRGVLPASLVNTQASGCLIDATMATQLEKKWASHLKATYSQASQIMKPQSLEGSSDDSIDDLQGTDSSLFGSDGSKSVKKIVSGVIRDPKVRRWVAKRAKHRCERSECDDQRDYPGFIDVHHILGAGKGDRVWNCVALCPNCHREAHFAPNRVAINKALTKYARQFKPRGK